MKARTKAFWTMFAGTLVIAGCTSSTDDPKGTPKGILLPAGEHSYVTVTDVETPEGTSTLIAFTPDLPSGKLNVSGALEIPGGATVKVNERSLYVGDNEKMAVTRYDIENDRLVVARSMGLQGKGLTWIDEFFFASAERAFTVNPDQLQIIEWNPKTMEITKEHDIAALKRDGWGSEYRGGRLRADGVLFFYWAYTNKRETFVNDFIVGVFDTKTGAFNVIVDEDCPASAGFGGFFDEKGDLYLIADSFGGFTYLGSNTPKDACIRRIRAGERAIDKSYTVNPMTALGGGRAPWGLYYAGNGIAYTTAVDPALLPRYKSVYEFLFATIHEGYVLDLAAGTSTKIEAMPPDAVGFNSVTIEGQALIPRSAGSVRLYEIDNVQTKVYSLSGTTKKATPQFTMPGFLQLVARLR